MSDKPGKYMVGGSHYLDMGLQPWKVMEHWLSPEEFKGFLKGNAIKYLSRAGKKGGLNAEAQDIRKARHYLDKLLEVMGDE